MPIPLKLVDRESLLSERLAEHVRERAEKLGHFYGRVMRCRVAVDGPGQHPLHGRFRVRVSLGVPGTQIAINRQAGEDLPTAIRAAFDAADHRLEDYVRLRMKSLRDVKRRPRKERRKRSIA